MRADRHVTVLLPVTRHLGSSGTEPESHTRRSRGAPHGAYSGGRATATFCAGYLLETAVTRVFIQAHPVMLKIFITGAVSQKTAKPSAWTIDHIPMGRFNKLTRRLIHLFRIPRCSGTTCKGSLVWMGCAGHQNDHQHYCQPIFHVAHLYPDEPGILNISHRPTQTHTDKLTPPWLCYNFMQVISSHFG